MNCADVRPWLGALLDNELDARHAAEIQAHLAECQTCARAYDAEAALRTGLRRAQATYSVPASLRERLISDLPDSADHAPGRSRSRTLQRPWTTSPAARWLLRAGWPVAIAATALLALNVTQQRSQLSEDFVALHVRSLLADHLRDIASSDRHTVKPWFSGRLDFAPPVPDLAASGFPLLGGRLDYLGDRAIAALVYQRRQHVINVFVSPRARGGPSAASARTYRGYAMVRWHDSGLEFVALSDVAPSELDAFRQAFLAAAPL